jgi:predicted DCC family thiol-disulfide oxidoreductase YuxK
MVNDVKKETGSQALPLTVLYDGACPLCRREIGVYRALPPLRPDAPLCFADVNAALERPGHRDAGS